jgi:hypothetical protein
MRSVALAKSAYLAASTLLGIPPNHSGFVVVKGTNNNRRSTTIHPCQLGMSPNDVETEVSVSRDRGGCVSC